MKTKQVVDKDICKECGGLCCKYAIRRMPVALMDNRHAEFFDARSVERKIIGQNVYYKLNQVCPHITEEGCDMGGDRPAICKDFPPYLDKDWHYFCKLSQKLYKN